MKCEVEAYTWREQRAHRERHARFRVLMLVIRTGERHRKFSADVTTEINRGWSRYCNEVGPVVDCRCEDCAHRKVMEALEGKERS